MKPVLDRMTDMIVAALSGEAKDFYDREFTFFNNVTSISGKLKPFIKKTKPEKKVMNICPCRFVDSNCHTYRLKLMRRWRRSSWMSVSTYLAILTASWSTSTRNLVDLFRVTPR